MLYAAHEARMRQPADKDGKVSTRTALQASARRGVASAVKLLRSPPFPESLAELWDIFQTLDGWRREGMAGPARLTLSDVERACQMYDWRLEPHEIEAIRMLDLVTRNPDALDAETVA